VIDKLSDALQKAVADPEVKARLDAMGVAAVAPDRARPEALRAHLKSEIDTLGPLLVRAGVKAE
jgi:tripartite-type tricarboxylate transporter receptor subunit TctC